MTAADILAEIQREAASRRAAYPRLIERLRLTESQALAEQQLCHAWAADVTRREAYLANPYPRPAPPLEVRVHGFTWAERRGGVQRELDRRARLYPKWIAAGELDQGEADTRTARLTALLDIYDDGWDWHDSFGRRFDLRAQEPDADQAEANRQWWAHFHETMARRNGAAAQESFAL